MIRSLQTTVKRRAWALVYTATGTVAGLGFLGTWFFVGVVSPEPLRQTAPPEAFIHLQPEQTSGLSRVEAEMALLEDPAPLFVPTEWNYLVRAQDRGYAPPDTPDLFDRFQARPILDSQPQPPPPWSFGEPAYSSPEDALSNSDWAYFVGFGERETVPPAPLPDRTAAYRLVRLKDGVRTVEGDVRLPETAAAPPDEWRPLEALVLVDAFGMAGQPIILSGSGQENWDAVLEDWIRESRFWTGVPPGYYLMVIGP